MASQLMRVLDGLCAAINLAAAAIIVKSWRRHLVYRRTWAGSRYGPPSDYRRQYAVMLALSLACAILQIVLMVKG